MSACSRMATRRTTWTIIPKSKSTGSNRNLRDLIGAWRRHTRKRNRARTSSTRPVCFLRVPPPCIQSVPRKTRLGGMAQWLCVFFRNLAGLRLVYDVMCTLVSHLICTSQNPIGMVGTVTVTFFKIFVYKPYRRLRLLFVLLYILHVVINRFFLQSLRKTY